MAIVLLQFSSLSSPVAVGDQAYYIDNLAVSAGDDAFSFGTDNNNVISLGPVVNVEGNSIYVCYNKCRSTNSKRLCFYIKR